MAIWVHFNDGVIGSNSPEAVPNFKRQLHKEFDIKWRNEVRQIHPHGVPAKNYKDQLTTSGPSRDKLKPQRKQIRSNAFSSHHWLTGLPCQRVLTRSSFCHELSHMSLYGTSKATLGSLGLSDGLPPQNP
ncbi:hypothetical protein O181_110400 [Austropuccinia psidii MF-1]|uniref:Uncharacterized protein n=1 Tax=Austropuccinia psidii MF-1 TaxID=1389203 RepID=A0A9Q3K0B0_9BASI|nr:hypothetical protein [Austropuccinia psidii MF-1]